MLKRTLLFLTLVLVDCAHQQPNADCQKVYELCPSRAGFPAAFEPDQYFGICTEDKIGSFAMSQGVQGECRCCSAVGCDWSFVPDDLTINHP